MNSKFPIPGCLEPYLTSAPNTTITTNDVIVQVQGLKKQSDTLFACSLSDTKHLYPGIFTTCPPNFAVIRITSFTINHKQFINPSKFDIVNPLKENLPGNSTYHPIYQPLIAQKKQNQNQPNQPNQNQNQYQNQNQSPNTMYQNQNSYNNQNSYQNNNNNNNYGSSNNNYSSSGAPITFIDQLNSQTKNFTIRAKVKSLSEIKKWTNPGSNGILFSMEVADDSHSDRNEIKIAAFGEQCVDKFYHLLEVGRVYLISNGSIRTNNRKFNQTKHDFEINLTTNSTISPCNEDVSVTTYYNFTTIEDLENYQANNNASNSGTNNYQSFDVLGEVESADSQVTIVKPKDKAELQKYSIKIRDNTNKSVAVTFWGQEAENNQNNFNPGIIVAFKNLRVNNYNNGISLTYGKQSQATINPTNIVQADHLKAWCQANSGNQSQSISKDFAPNSSSAAAPIGRFAIRDVLKLVNQGDPFQVCGTITRGRKLWSVKDNTPSFTYKNCLNCKKSHSKCNCGQNNFINKYMLSTRIYDETGSIFATLFDDYCEKLLGVKADELLSMGEEQANSHVDKKLNREFLFTIKYQESKDPQYTTPSYSVTKVEPVQFIAQCHLLDSKISLATQYYQIHQNHALQQQQ